MPLLLIPLLLGCLNLARAAEHPTVAVLTSEMLPAPVSRDSVLADADIDEMVRQAMELGGIRQVLRADAKHVLLKPCIVVAERDSWRNVDPRAVRAVALVVHDIAPQARITVGEGPGAWMKEARPEVRHWELNIADGFETEGYRAALSDPRLRDAQIEFVDLNFAEPRLVKVPGGGWARDEYWIAAPVLDADVAITIPRLKTHMPDHGGITVAMKNQMGVAPGMKYGWPKKTGYPSGSGNPGIPHSPEILGEMITDLNLCARIDFAVAESFRRAFDENDEGHPTWINGVVAGADLVAVDAVSAYLMGFNPEEVETVVNGARRGLGVGRLEAIEVVGEKDLDHLRRGFPVWGQMGMANRSWLVSGPHPHTEAGLASVDPAAPIAPDLQGFGEPVWFQDDKCDLGQLLAKPTDCTAFAYCEFTAPAGGPAKLQVASDEGMTIWLNGVQVYRFEGWRRIERPNDLAPVELQPGANHLLCRLEQSSRQFQFSVNVVEDQPSPVARRYQRPPGLRFSVPGEQARQEVEALDIDFHDSWRPQGWWREVTVDQTRPDSLVLAGAVPALLQAGALGVVRSRCFGDQVRARALVRGDQLIISSAGAAELWADLGALRGRGQPAEVKAVELVLRWEGGLVETVRDSALVWSGTVPEKSILVLSRPDTTSSLERALGSLPAAGRISGDPHRPDHGRPRQRRLLPGADPVDHRGAPGRRVPRGQRRGPGCKSGLGSRRNPARRPPDARQPAGPDPLGGRPPGQLDHERRPGGFAAGGLDQPGRRPRHAPALGVHRAVRRLQAQRRPPHPVAGTGTTVPGGHAELVHRRQVAWLGPVSINPHPGRRGLPGQIHSLYPGD